ncbi:gem-associated protein 2 [Diprion similis]|uniref:gem-associated protein 2 n=1 Tax=Diprion similis TaxID=362088 RepID=UPI001EF99B07|nr:gem-associated protein 2 [Diprion similis]
MGDILREPALFVGEFDTEIDLMLPPSSGEEYIKRVVIEAQQCDDVVVAENLKARIKTPTAAVKPLAGCVEAPASMVPTLDWQQCQLADFSSVRLEIDRIKHDLQNAEGRRRLRQTVLPDADDQVAWLEYICSMRPLLGLVLNMNQPLIEQVLEHLVEAVEEKGLISQPYGGWIYALLATLELPLNPDTCSCLRSLARACSIIRANMTEENAKDVAALNLFICLVARYFRQMDLVDL